MYLFFFNDTATTEIYTLSLHDALPISRRRCGRPLRRDGRPFRAEPDHRPARHKIPEARNPVAARRASNDFRAGALRRAVRRGDRKSTRLNSSHANISYAVFCLKKKTTL